MNTEDVSKMYSIKSFLTEEFVERKLSIEKFEKVLFTKDSLSEGDYLSFKKDHKQPPSFEVKRNTPDYTEFEASLAKLDKLVQSETYSVNDLYDVLFKGDFFPRPERATR